MTSELKELEISEELLTFIRKELTRTWNARYYKYIDEYIKNIMPHQLVYWQAWSEGKMGIY